MAGPWEKYKPDGPWARYKRTDTNAGEQLASGLFEGASAVGSAVVDIPEAVGRGVIGGIDRLFGTNLGGPLREADAIAGAPLGSMDRTMAAADDAGILAPPPQTLPQSLARRFGVETGASAPFLGVGILSNPASIAANGFRGYMMADTGANIGATVAGEAAANVAPGNQTAEDLARLAGGVGGGLIGSRVAGGMDRSAAGRDYVQTAPQNDELLSEAKRLYDEGHSLGIKVKPAGITTLDGQMRGAVADRGLITPSGKIVENAKLRQVFNLLDEYKAGGITTKQMQALRSVIDDVAGDADPRLSSVGVQLKRLYDDFMSGIAPQFKEANVLYARAMRGEMMDKAEELADIRASQFSQSGTENALRTEFRQMDRDIARGNTRGLRPDQVQAIQDVSRGTPATNVARQVGKMAPRGVVSAGFHSVPFMVGNAIGGPALGGALAGGTMATGVLGQGLATLLQRNAASRAGASMRQALPLSLPPRMAGVLGLIPALSGQAATTGPR